VSYDVTCSGPVFDGRAAAAARRAAVAIRAKLADDGAKLAEMTLAASIRHHGSGRAERSVTTTASSRIYQTGKYTMPVVVGDSETLVTTDLATYGPWLEGTGSRNLTTRFHGYHAFRLAAQELDRAAEGIAEVVIAPYVREMQ
jgi:hypothetical protein